MFTPPKPLSAQVIGVSGADLVPLAGALGLVALACLAAVIATRGVLRRVAGALLAALGAGAGVAAATGVSAATVVSVAASKVGSPAAAAVSGAAGSTTSGSAGGTGGVSVIGATGQAIMTGTPWRVAVLAGALLVVAAGVATAWRGPSWPVMSARYDAPEPPRGPRGRGAPWRRARGRGRGGPGTRLGLHVGVAQRGSRSHGPSLAAMPAYGAGVLVADHEPEVGEMSRRYLARAGLSVQVVATPGATLGALAERAADLFAIDLTMPALDVIDVRRALAQGAPVPVVFLLDRQGRRPRGLADGLDGPCRWLARPFSPRALVDAVSELLRPAGPPGAGLLGAAAPDAVAVPPPRASAAPSSLHLDPGRRSAVVAGRDVPLTRSELAILTALAGQPGRALRRDQLLAALEGERGKRPGTRAIDVYIVQLREKLGTDLIQTVHGVGYVLRLPGGVQANPPEK